MTIVTSRRSVRHQPFRRRTAAVRRSVMPSHAQPSPADDGATVGSIGQPRT
jgi:hypothetical protein